MTATIVSGSATPPELLRLIEELDPRPARVEALAPVDSYRPAAAAFRVALADGRCVKARLLATAGRAERIECVLRALQHAAFPAVLARQGRVLLLEWIDGEPMSEHAPRPTQVRAAAAIQAYLHAMPLRPPLEPPPADVVGEIAAKLEDDNAALAADGIISPADATAILASVRRFRPDRCRVGIVHRDLCARNMVVRSSGEICLIDNETIAVSSCEFDLARTWYRWPLPRGAREEYFQAYARTHGMEDFLAHFPFWALAVLVDSARMRADAPAPLRSVPVDRLRALLAALHDGATPERLALQT